MHRTKGSKENHKMKMAMKRERRKSFQAPKFTEEQLINWMKTNGFIRGKYPFAH